MIMSLRTCRVSGVLLVSTFLLLLLSLCSFVAAAASSAPLLCQSISSEFDFPKKPPTKVNELAFCKEYKSSTCCTHSTTLTVLRSLSSLFHSDSSGLSESFTDACRQISSTIACAPCHPEVGTRKRIGVCPHLCSQWYQACRNGLYTEVDGILKPCTDSSLICAPLHTIVEDGQQMCQRTHVGAGQITPHRPFDEEIRALVAQGEGEGGDGEVTSEDQPEESVGCFDGSIPTVTRTPASGESATYTPPEDAGTARKRYYKTAEEVAEIEKRRAQRAERDAAKASENHPFNQAMKLIQRTMRDTLTPFNRAWSRLVRKATFLPRSIREMLEGPFVFSILLMIINSIIWTGVTTFITRIYARCRGRRTRTSGGASVPLSSSGLTPDEIRMARLQALATEQYVQSAASEYAGAFRKAGAAAQPKGTYTTVIDGEIVTLPE